MKTQTELQKLKLERDMQIIALATGNKDVKDMNCSQIAKKFNISRQRVEQILKKHGVSYDASRPSKHIKEAVLMYENGALIREIEEKLGVSCASTILKRTNVRRGMGCHRKMTTPSEKILNIFKMQKVENKSLHDIAAFYNSTAGAIGVSMVRARKRWGLENILQLIK